MPMSDFVPGFGERNLSAQYRNVLGVPVRKRVVIAVVTVFVLFFIFVFALIFSKAPPVKKSKTESMVHVPIASAINSSVDPCEDFYEFSCGLWSRNDVVSESLHLPVSSFNILQDSVDKKKQEVLENARVTNHFPDIVNDAIKFYAMCKMEINSEGLDFSDVLSYMHRVFGGWPLLNPSSWNESNFDWITASANLFRTSGLKTLVEVLSIRDDRNSSKHLTFIRPMVHHPVTLDDVFTHDTLVSILLSIKNPVVNVTQVLSGLEKIKKTEVRWNKYFSSRPTGHNGTIMTFKVLQRDCPHFDWLNYIQLIFNDTLNSVGESISEQDEVVFESFEFLNSTITSLQLEAFSKYELANLFGWFIVQDIWFLIPVVFNTYSNLFDFSVDERKETSEKNCLDAVSKLYPCSLDYLFVQTSTHRGIADGKVFVHYIKKTYEDLITSADWLDNSTKNLALLKLNSMHSIIGYPKYLGDKSEFDRMFEDFPRLSKTILETYFTIQTFETSSLALRIKLPDSEAASFVTPRPITDVSAYYDMQRNIFTLPISIYNPPFYYYGGPWYLNFGAIGSIIGHEIMHAFSRAGCERGETGSTKKWWLNSTYQTYLQHAECYTKQYALYGDLNHTLKGDWTLDEDIADNEGLRVAYLAYKLWEKDNGPEESCLMPYTADQLFYLSFGSVWCSKTDLPHDHTYFNILRTSGHSPNKLRVIGCVSNSEYFSHIYDCPKNAPMNPTSKCLMW